MTDEKKNKYFKAGRRIGYKRGLEDGYRQAQIILIEKLNSLTKSIEPKNYNPLEVICWNCGIGFLNSEK